LAAAEALPADTLYDLACVYALCAAAARADENQAGAYADRAVELLRRAVATGFNDARRLKKDPNLGAIRARDGFQKLLGELEKKQD